MKRDVGRLTTLGLSGIAALLALLATVQSFGVGSGFRLLDETPTALEQDLTQPMEQLEFRLPEFAQ